MEAGGEVVVGRRALDAALARAVECEQLASLGAPERLVGRVVARQVHRAADRTRAGCLSDAVVHVLAAHASVVGKERDTQRVEK